MCRGLFQGDTSVVVLSFYVLVFKIFCAVGVLCMFSYIKLSLGNRVATYWENSYPFGLRYVFMVYVPDC